MSPALFIWRCDMSSRRSTKPNTTVYSHRYRQPSLWNSLKFNVRRLPLFNPMSEFPMRTSRRNVFIRSITGLCGDIAVGFAMASACVWIIEAASLGLFLSFLLWLIATMATEAPLGCGPGRPWLCQLQVDTEYRTTYFCRPRPVHKASPRRLRTLCWQCAESLPCALR